MACVIFLACLFSNVFMFGVICFVQAVHYPLFIKFDFPRWRELHEFHSFRTSLVVGGPLAVQGLSTLYLYVAPTNVPLSISERAGLGICLLLSLGSTAAISVPLHSRLGANFNLNDAKSLLLTNWLRVVGWGGGALILARVALKICG